MRHHETQQVEWAAYNEKSLEHMMTVSATLAIATYMLYTVSADPFRIFPEKRMEEYLSQPGYAATKGPPKTVKRGGEHKKDWFDAITQGRSAGCDFADFGGPLTEVALLSIIAMNFAGQKLLWAGPNAKFTNNDEANKLINPPYREGWTL
jgi:hypothetical protein